MENETSSGYEKFERSEYDMTSKPNPLSYKISLPYHHELADDILLGDFPEEETFVLSKEYVLMEGEYVMWEGPCR